ncbi:hypothetical protein PMY35_08760 [Clostridium tertium]|uniref:CDP-glycerol glycerophosphotransferase family protein n=1 Tax=Clostridium tertium TaxID=1559 RepID=UPI000DCFEDF6|nr:CDP-glycerol glycerophosphotransferase family protein [Clostridium tertium]MDB1942014.1 hypothetical protein [Clostridium tertium]MDB1947914.1 hypothetical protein [Clostridium tertium]
MNKIYGNLDILASSEFIRVKFKALKLEEYNLIKNKELTIDSTKFQIDKVDDVEHSIEWILEDYIGKINKIHNIIYIENAKRKIYILDTKYKEYKNGFLLKKVQVDDNYIGLRSTINSDKSVISIVPYYEGCEDTKIEFFEENLSLEHDKKYVLFFEKKSETYGESSFQVFKNYMKESKFCRFVLSKKNPDFDLLREKYGEFILEKGSIEFYKILFQTKLLVSSELPANLISGNSIDMQLNAFINQIPFIFLQHGVMFSKPIDSPNAKMFWKNNIKYNLIKTVVSSELEKEQFYKVGYSPNDLIKTGLATLDCIDREKEKKYIAYMPTYRFWENMKIYNGLIEETSYYKDIKHVINVMEALGKIEELVLIPHPGYNGFINYDKIFPDVKFATYTEIRDEIKVFITDFSSAAYDAHYRGSSIIYFWNRRNELESKYGKNSPLNEKNTNGIPVYSELDLYLNLKYLYNNNFKMKDFYETNFRKIIEYSDGKNTNRIIEFINEYLKNPSKEEELFSIQLKSDIVFEMENLELLMLSNFKDNMQELNLLNIEKLISGDIENNKIKIENLKYRDKEHMYFVLHDKGEIVYAQLLDKKYFDKEGCKFELKMSKLKTNKYLSADIFIVSKFGKPKRYHCKFEIDFRKNKNLEEVFYKKRKLAVPRDTPYICYTISTESEDSYVRLYKHDLSFNEKKISKNSTIEITLTHLEVSHILLGRGACISKKVNLK